MACLLLCGYEDCLPVGKLLLVEDDDPVGEGAAFEVLDRLVASWVVDVAVAEFIGIRVLL